jgi:SUKH-3 immunity protein of toxin-antitoxin system
MQKSQLSRQVARVLQDTGWREHRQATSQVEMWTRALSPEFVPFPAARNALARFGGIRVEQDSPGEECARETFELDPLLAAGEEDLFRSCEAILSAKLYPLGESGGGNVFLAISDAGEVHALMHDIWLVGTSIEEALERLIRGLTLQKVHSL